jgi:hypothetical protein
MLTCVRDRVYSSRSIKLEGTDDWMDRWKEMNRRSADRRRFSTYQGGPVVVRGEN